MVKVTSNSIILSSALTQKKKMGFTGSIGMWVGSSPPAGALFCDGATYNTADYPGLAASLGISSGIFQVPNLKSKLPFGTTGPPRTTGGNLHIQNIAHQHVVNQSRFKSVSDGSRPEIGDGSWSEQFTGEQNTNVTSTNNTNVAQIDYLPPYLAVNFIIYT